MMTRRALESVRFVAVMGDPPAHAWSAVSSVACEIDGEEQLLVADAIGAQQVEGYLTPPGWLESAVERGLATRLEPPIRARADHLLVLVDADHYELRHRDDIFAARRDELSRRLGDAVRCFAADADAETLRDRFDAAYVVAPEDIVVVSLRAGAGALRGAPDWKSEVIEDLVRVSEHHGTMLGNVCARPLWAQLPQHAARDRLLEAAILALSRALAAPTELLPPVPPQTFERAARIAAAWRRDGARAIPGISQRILRAAVKGEPEALGQAERLAGPAVAQWPASAQPLDEARGRLTDLEKFAQTVYALELRVERRDRGSLWHSFLSETAGVTAPRWPRPWKQGEVLAESLRHQLGLNGQPMRGLKRLVSNRAGVLVQAGEEIPEVDALGAASARIPPCIQFVGPGASERPGSARFALAHQLCHFMVDRQSTALSSWACSSAGHHGEHVSAEEKRARAFAAYFLAPREAVLEIAGAEPVPLARRTDFVERAMRVRDKFGLTAVTSGEHLLNCWPSTSTDEARTPLSAEIRRELRRAADRSGPLAEFADDCPGDAAADVPASGALRRGVFSDLVRAAVRAHAIELSEAAALLGSPDAVRWLSQDAGK